MDAGPEASVDRIKRAFAIAALGTGAIATIVWILLLGWAATEWLETNAVRLMTHQSHQHAAIAAPLQPGMGNKQPSPPIETPPKHP
jgi:hypothetical protein